MRIRSLNISYRGFALGYAIGHLGFLPAWRSSLERDWTQGHIYVDALTEIEQLARECIDYQYRIEAAEAVLGRKLAMNELTPDL